MSGYKSVDELRRVFGGFLDVVRQDDRTRFGGTGVVVVYRITDLETDVVLDSTVEPRPGATFEARVGGPEPANPTCVFEMSSDTLDRIFSGTLPPIIAIVTRAVKARGDHLKVMQTVPSLRRAIPLYREWCNRERSPG